MANILSPWPYFFGSDFYQSLCQLPHALLSCSPLAVLFTVVAKGFRVNSSCLRSSGLTADALHSYFSSDTVNVGRQHSLSEWGKENSNWWSILSCTFKNNCIIILCPLKPGCFFSMTAGLGFNFSFLALIIEQFSGYFFLTRDLLQIAAELLLLKEAALTMKMQEIAGGG